jgi:hypothetical protein
MTRTQLAATAIGLGAALFSGSEGAAATIFVPRDGDLNSAILNAKPTDETSELRALRCAATLLEFRDAAKRGGSLATLARGAGLALADGCTRLTGFAWSRLPA